MMYLKTRPAWAQLFMFIGLAFGSFIVLSMIGILILSRITGLDMMTMMNESNWDYTNPVTLTFLRGMLLIQFLSLFIIPCFLWSYFSDPVPSEYLGLRSSKAIYFLAGVAVMVFATPFVDWLGTINHQLIPESTSTGKWMKEAEDATAKQIAFMLKRNTIKDLLINLLFVAGFAGVGEELFFRGVLQRIFIKLFKSPATGIIITSIIFSAVHFQFYGFFPRFILGVLLGLIYWYSGSLWPAILAHFAYDGLAVTVIYFNPAMADQENVTGSLGNQSVMAAISAVLVLFLVFIMKRRSTNSYEAVYAKDKIDESDPFSV